MRLEPVFVTVLAALLASACREARLDEPVARPRPDGGTGGVHLDATSGDAQGPLPDSGLFADAGPRADATSGDAGASDAGPAGDVGPGQDAALRPDASGGQDAGPGGDAGSASACDRLSFSLTRQGATSVWLTGTFTAWAATPAAGAIPMSASGDTWSVTTTLPRGRQLYKFIVDGSTWVEDPNAAEREPDGHNGFNSVVNVCTGPAFSVLSHQTDSAARTFNARVEYRGAAPLAQLLSTLDLSPAQVSVNGSIIDVALTGLTDGIHDLRLSAGDDEALLKIYINESTDWRDTVIYFAMTDRFRNGDTSNDAPIGGALGQADYMGGDFAGIEAAINDGYFDGLGVNAVWITWPLDNPDRTFDGVYPVGPGCNPAGRQTGPFTGYHGYWPKSGRDIESRFGTMAELQRMVVAAHAHGIRILLDFTANHVHTDAADYMTNANNWFNQPPVMCGDGHWDDDLKEECWFEPYLADWNYDVASAREKVIDDAMWLAKKTGADGFRVDALKHMEDQFIRDLRARTHRELELTGIPFYMVGETFTGDVGTINRYVQADMMHAQFDFPSNYAILQGLARNDIGLDALHGNVRGIKAGYGASAPLMSTFIGNHDLARFISLASGDLGCGVWSVLSDRVRAFDNPPAQPTGGDPYRRLELAMTYNFTVPGIPLVYYGDEVGLAGGGDPDNRRMMPASGSLNAEQNRTLAFMQRLGAARRDHAALRQGGWTDALWADTTALVFARTHASEKALIALNRGDARTVTVDVSSLGIAGGTTLNALFGSGAVSVNGTQVELNLARLGAEIWIAQ